MVMIFPKAQKLARTYDWYKTMRLVPTRYRGYFFKENMTLPQQSTPEPGFCQVCEEEDAVRYYAISSKDIVLCGTCAMLAQKKESVAVDVKKSNSYAVGFLGAMIFAVLGIIAWTYVGLFLTKFTTPLVVLLAYLVHAGYFYFKGPIGKATSYIILFSILLSIAIATLTTMVIELTQHGYSIEASFAAWFKGYGVFAMWFRESFFSFVIGFVVWLWLVSGVKAKDEVVNTTDNFATAD